MSAATSSRSRTAMDLCPSLSMASRWATSMALRSRWSGIRISAKRSPMTNYPVSPRSCLSASQMICNRARNGSRIERSGCDCWVSRSSCLTFQGASDGATVEGMSKVRHPLSARGGRAVQRERAKRIAPNRWPSEDQERFDLSQTCSRDELATALEMDMNHYVTVRSDPNTTRN